MVELVICVLVGVGGVGVVLALSINVVVGVVGVVAGSFFPLSF